MLALRGLQPVTVRTSRHASSARRIAGRPFATASAGLVCVLLWLLAGCSGPRQVWMGRERIDLWAVPEGATVFADSPKEPENEVFSAGEGRVRLAGAVNEAVSFQVAFRSDQPATIANVSVGDLRGRDQVIPADRAAFFREVRVPVGDYPAWFLRLTPYLKQPRSYPDVLVPLAAPRGALPIELGQARLKPSGVRSASRRARRPAGTNPNCG